MPRPVEPSAPVPNAPPPTSWSSRRIPLLFAAALLVKLCFLGFFEHSLYGDVIRAVNFGKLYLADRSHFAITSKTFVGPVSWWVLYEHLGLRGLKVFNLVTFALLFDLQRRIGRRTVSDDAVVIALALFAFYPGTNLTVVAGEQDDGVTLVLFALGVLLYLQRGAVFAAGLLMGCAFLFKFTAAIFFAGFALYLLIVHGPRACAAAVVGMIVPFLLTNLADGFDSTRNLLFAVDVQIGFSTWRGVGFKLVSTGMLLAVLLSWWEYLERRNATTLLFCLIPSAYLAYVLLSRDAFSAGFVMMQGIFFAAFPIAQFLLRHRSVERFVTRRSAIRVALAAYALIAIAITWRNVAYDTIDARDHAASLVLLDPE